MKGCLCASSWQYEGSRSGTGKGMNEATGSQHGGQGLEVTISSRIAI